MQRKILEILNHPNLALGASDPESLLAPFTRFCQLWQKWNEKINLTSEKDWESFFERHVFDSLQFARVVPEGCSVLDIGSGGGFPGATARKMHGIVLDARAVAQLLEHLQGKGRQT